MDRKVVESAAKRLRVNGQPRKPETERSMFSEPMNREDLKYLFFAKLFVGLLMFAYLSVVVYDKLTYVDTTLAGKERVRASQAAHDSIKARWEAATDSIRMDTERRRALRQAAAQAIDEPEEQPLSR